MKYIERKTNVREHDRHTKHKVADVRKHLRTVRKPIIGVIPLKDLTYPQAKKRFPFLNPNGNIDGDNKINKKDCRPFDSMRQDDEVLLKFKEDIEEEKENEEVWERLYAAQKEREEKWEVHQIRDEADKDDIIGGFSSEEAAKEFTKKAGRAYGKNGNEEGDDFVIRGKNGKELIFTDDYNGEFEDISSNDSKSNWDKAMAGELSDEDIKRHELDSFNRDAEEE